MFKGNEKKPNRHESEHPQHDSLETVREETLTRYEQVLETLKNESIFLSDAPSRRVPEFGPDEIDIGEVLGVGGFCAVREVKDMRLDPSLSHLQPEFQEDDDEFRGSETRDYMSLNFLRDQSSRYAIKRMKQQFDDEKQRHRGMLDLALEAEYLSHLSHPNIVKMRGALACESRVKEPGFYIVLDRLHMTLLEKIEDTWPKEYKGMVGPFGRLGKDKTTLRMLFLERYVVHIALLSRDFVFYNVLRQQTIYLHHPSSIYSPCMPQNDSCS